MVSIRLARHGRKKAPFYRIVAMDSQKKTRGSVLEILGTWNPAKKELSFEKEKLDIWIQKGAQMSETVKRLVEGKNQKIL